MRARKIAERKKVEGRIRKAAAAAMFDVRSLTFDVKTNKPEGTTSVHRDCPPRRVNSMLRVLSNVETPASQRDWAGTKFAVTCGVHDIKFCDEPPISDRAS